LPGSDFRATGRYLPSCSAQPLALAGVCVFIDWLMTTFAQLPKRVPE
jgi:hypothetical protein